MKNPTEKISIRIPVSYLRVIDFLVDAGYYQSRAAAINEAVRDQIYKKVDLSEQVEKVKKIELAHIEMEKVREKYLKK